MIVNFNPQKIGVNVIPQTAEVDVGNPIARIEPSPYEGTYEVTPSSDSQTLRTAGKTMERNVTVNPIPSEYADVSGTTAEANDVQIGKKFVTAQGVLTDGTATVATLTTKSITENGTYNATDDGADGYSEVTVNVPQGVIVPTGWAYYNGYLLPKIPYADGYNFAWIRANGATGMFDCVLGKSQWYVISSSGLNAWSIAFANNTTLGARQYSIPMDAQEQSTSATSWGDYTVSYAATYGTGNNRKPIFTDTDIMIQGTSNICLRHGFSVPMT